MKILTSGHKYELENFEAKDQPGQVIQFVEKTLAPGQTLGVLATVNDGTTNEEVLKMLIDRHQTLYDRIPSDETACSIFHLKSALYAQQSRTYDRQQRGVEGKHLK
jgi:hypothetical protein